MLTSIVELTNKLLQSDTGLKLGGLLILSLVTISDYFFSERNIFKQM